MFQYAETLDLSGALLLLGFPFKVQTIRKIRIGEAGPVLFITSCPAL